ncbi:MAG: Gfo/Idh/MocA family oxidoreductase [Anaerolineae bacterium]
MNIGVIGAGRIGKVHAENLALGIQETNVVAIADVVLSAAQETAARLRIRRRRRTTAKFSLRRRSRRS